jgi:hypothetical protein
MPSPRDLARIQALGRIALGGALTVAPRLATTAWIGARTARRPGAQVVAAALGARDLAIGAGTARAVAQGHGAPPWLLAGAFADAVDLVASVRARDELPAFGVVSVVAMAGGSTALGLWLRGRLD